MIFQRSALAVSAVALGILPLLACGSDRSAVTTAPSSTLSAVAVEQSVVTGARVSPLEDTGIAITSLVTGTSCPTLQFRISTYLIKTDAATTYSGGTCTSLQAGTKISLTTTRIGTDSDLTVYASQITIRTGTTTPTPTPTPTNPTTPIQADVTISGVTGTCPDVMFVVSTYAFKVSSSTGYSGAACADIKVGAKVSVVGTKSESDSFIVVTGLGIKRGDTPTTPTTPTSPTSPSTVTGEAAVTSLGATTACPTLTFIVGGSYTVVASAATHYEAGGSCAAIRVGTKLALTGTRLGDTSIAATNIAFKDGGSTPTEPTRPTQPAEGEGVITSLSTGTGCPALQFFIGTYLIKLDASTLFDRGACRDLTIGQRVHVKGGLTGDGTVLASQISVQSDSPGSPVVEGDGKVSSLVSGTACPALKFLIEEYTVTLNASTTFVGGSCSDVAAGKKLGVKGTVTGEKQVLATQIVFKNGDN